MSSNIHFYTEKDSLIFGSSNLLLKFSNSDGTWLALTQCDLPEHNFISPVCPSIGVDVRIDGEDLLCTTNHSLRRYNVEENRTNHSATLSLEYEVGNEYLLTTLYTLDEETCRLRRSAHIERSSKAEGSVHFEGFHFIIPGTCIGDPQDCRINVPGPWFPSSFIAPDTPYSDLITRTQEFHTAPDCGFGVLSLSNIQLKQTLATWMDTAGEVAYIPSISGDGQHLSFRHFDQRAYRLEPGMSVSSDAQEVVIVHGQLDDALPIYQRMIECTMPLDSSSPDWVKEMVLLEVLPTYFPGGLPELTDRLPFYREIGFNTIYLMPHWLGGYCPIDLYQVDPALGTPEDLRTFVDTAHQLGMRVLFDMVIHGVHATSALVREHPEFFIHNEDGGIALHPCWKSHSTDWAHPGYQQYMVDLVRHDQLNYGNDGYRVDAASFKGANWSSNMPYPAYKSATESPMLMRKMLQALRVKNPEAVLLSEVYGPVFYTVCNLAHDNQTEAPQMMLELIEQGKATAEDYKTHMANTHDLLADGANRVYFARNHDTSWFYHFNGYTPRFLALDAIHALCAIPEVFAGDPNHGPNPDDDQGIYAFYQKLFAFRRSHLDLMYGQLLLREVSCDNNMVFTALRQYHDRVTIVVVSLSDNSEDVTINYRVPGDLAVSTEKITFYDPINGSKNTVGVVNGTSLTLTLQPFQVFVGEWQ